MTASLSTEWSQRFGLAVAPLFERGEIETPENHAVLLNGGSGSFVLSKDGVDPRWGASWAWSSGLPHHVSIAENDVVVTRWDAPEASERFTLRSVSNKPDAFYAYLAKRWMSGRRDVVGTLLDLFRGVRGEVQVAGADDTLAVSEFLDVLANLVSAERPGEVRGANFLATWKQENPERQSVLSTPQIQRLEIGFRQQTSALRNMTLHTSLAVRHAASAIFQEAHFAFRSAMQADLFAYQPATASRLVNRGAHHFTPPSLARTIAEQALARLPDLKARQELTVCDPACGSGAFLTEALRTLRRLGYAGRLNLVGRDISRSAIDMARFALHASRFDWEPAGGITFDLAAADALDEGAVPPSDLIMMNPPFLAWSMMDRAQREQVTTLLGADAKHRPDLSMCFVLRALEQLKEGGVVASLLPSSILALESAKGWRNRVLEMANLAFLGSFGEYGLFVHAIVQVAAIILAKGPVAEPAIALRAEDESAATGEALRALRRLELPLVAGVSGSGWRITRLDPKDLVNATRWRILPENIEAALGRLNELGIGRVGDIFDVKQGLLTGLNDAFILSSPELEQLPARERVYFRPAIFRDAISGGEIREKYFVFFPYKKAGLVFASEQELVSAVPTFFDSHLSPRRDRLRSRSGVDEARSPWWALSRYYAWSQRSEGRIVTKYFGRSGDVAVDTVGSYIPLQSYAWFLRRGRKSESSRAALRTETALRAYAVLLNSQTFSALLNIYSDTVQGGQFNLSGRFVRPIPLPDLFIADMAPLLGDLNVLWGDQFRLSSSWHDQVNRLSRRAWGGQLVDALLDVHDA
jgi:hypothetical protein